MSLAVALDITPGLLIRAGTGRYSRELHPALQKIQGLSVVPVATRADSAASTARRLANASFRAAVYYPLLLSRRAARVQADVIHCPVPAPIRSRHIPFLVTIHDLLPLTHPGLLPPLAVARTRASIPFIRAAARVLTNSEHTRAEVIERLGLAEDRVVTTPFGIHDRFRPLPGDAEWLAARFGLTRRYLLSVGTLEPRKNLVGLLRAYTILQREIEDCQVLLVGARGWKNRELDAVLAGRRDVRLSGFVTDEELVRLYSSCACFVYPSMSEGFGFPPLEAMACGAPVVASDRGALPEVLGTAALLCDPSDAHAIARAMTKILEDDGLSADLRRRGIQRSRLFRWERCAEATAQIYWQVAQEGMLRGSSNGRPRR